MPIYNFNNLEKQFEKFRIKLDQGFITQKYGIQINLENDLVSLLNTDYPQLIEIKNIPILDGIVIYGDLLDDTFIANVASLDLVDEVGLIGKKIGISLMTDTTSPTAQNLLEAMEYIKYFDIDIEKCVLLLYYFDEVNNTKDISAYMIYPKLYTLFKEDILSLSNTNNIILSDKELEIYDKNGVKKTKQIPIELVYKPISIQQI